MRAWSVRVKCCSPLTSFALHTDRAAWRRISEQHTKPTNCALKLGRKGKTAGKVHYLKCRRMRNRCRHGISGVASRTAYAGCWQAKLVSDPQLCKTHHHNWHPGWQSQPRVSNRGCGNILPFAIVPPPWKGPKQSEGNQTAPVWEINTTFPFPGLSVHYLSPGLKFTETEEKKGGRKAKGCICSLIQVLLICISQAEPPAELPVPSLLWGSRRKAFSIPPRCML